MDGLIDNDASCPVMGYAHLFQKYLVAHFHSVSFYIQYIHIYSGGRDIG